MHCRLKSSPIGAILRTPGVIREEREARERALDLLAAVGIQGRADTWARNLPYGDQRRLETARALATQPRLLLLDELLNELRGKHSLVVVEHDMDFVNRIARKVTVLHEGSVLAEGNMETVQNDPRVVEVYLGR